MDFVLVKNPGQNFSVWTHISALFGGHPAANYEDISALENIRKEFPVRRLLRSCTPPMRAYDGRDTNANTLMVLSNDFAGYLDNRVR